MKEAYLSIAIGKEASGRTFDFPDTLKGRELAHRVLARLGKYLDQHRPPSSDTLCHDIEAS